MSGGVSPRRPAVRWREALRADCANCAALCCVAPAFTASADFALDKPAATPCPHLARDCRCRIHDALRERGFPGCVVYDCFGAGQRVTQHTFAGRGWRGAPVRAAAMFAAFEVVRPLHERLWYLHEALALPAARALRPDLRAALADTERAAAADAESLTRFDLGAHRGRVNALLRAAADAARAAVRRRAPDHRGADLMGADLTGADLRAACLRGARLVGANLAGADLRGALFLVHAQLESARGNGATRLPAAHHRPAHWLRAR